MLLPIRSIAISAGVLCFFLMGILGSLGGLSPGTCCKRAVLGATVAYITTATAVRAINAILIQAMIAGQVQKREHSGDSKG
jgi:hypothetical protein